MALTARRNTPRYGQEPAPASFALKVKTATTCYAGGIAVVDATGYCVPATAADELIGVGRFEETVENPGASGAKLVNVLAGVFKWKNHGSDTIVQANMFGPAYAYDDETVGATAGAGPDRSKVGIIVGVESDGVWVAIGPHLL